jgi:hypothetical protein
MRSTGSTSHLRRALAHVPVRLTGAALAAVTLVASLLATTPPAGASALPDTATPVVWTGTDLVTAAINHKYQLYAYEQQPGASSWTPQLVATTAPDGEAFVNISMTATATSVQIAAVDGDGVIWFFQQIDGQSTWSAGQQVGSPTLGNSEGVQSPQIAWTGVPGHTGTNSVITIADGSGNILMWYQNGGGWTQETVQDGTSSDEFYGAAVTATDQGIVIVALRTDGGFYSYFQPYGPNPWVSDGTIDVGPDQSFDAAAVTWDGTNVDVAATYNSGTGLPNPDEIKFLWKPDAGSWNEHKILGPNSAEPFYGTPAITFTGSNLLLTATQQLKSRLERLDFWWQGSPFTNFNFESVVKPFSPKTVSPPGITYTDGASSPEAVITAPYGPGYPVALDAWTEPYGSPTWTRENVSRE